MAALDHPNTCDPECAWLVKAKAGSEWLTICAVVLVGKDVDRAPMNWLKDE